MGILSSLDRCINHIGKDVVENKTFYVELDSDNYEAVQEEISKIVGGEFRLSEQKVDDIGKSLVINYGEFKVVLIADKKKKKQDTFYVAFKSKIL